MKSGTVGYTAGSACDTRKTPRRSGVRCGRAKRLLLVPLAARASSGCPSPDRTGAVLVCTGFGVP